MTTTLEKARMYPDSMKAKILNSARILFGEYGYHGLTTRMIAKDVGIDASTLHYHWGDKEDLYEAVVLDINDEVNNLLRRIEKISCDKPVTVRLEVAIEIMCDYLFERPECAKMINLSHFNKTRTESIIDDRLSSHVTAFRKSLGLDKGSSDEHLAGNLRVLTAWNAAMNFASGEFYFMSVLLVDRKKYIDGVKDTLKSILVPVFSP